MTFEELGPSQKSALRQKYLLELLKAKKPLDAHLTMSLNGLKVTLAGISTNLLSDKDKLQIELQVRRMLTPVSKR